VVSRLLRWLKGRHENHDPLACRYCDGSLRFMVGFRIDEGWFHVSDADARRCFTIRGERVWPTPKEGDR
jgi:hypothetical protein